MARILLIDDDASFTGPFTALLSERGYEVVSLDNGDNLLELLLTENFDVVILDNYLNGMSGVEILHLLNRQEEDTGWHKPPIVLLTGDGSKDMELRARLAKSDFFLLKPCNYQELEERIEEALKKVQAEKESCEKEPDSIAGTVRK